jgi:hypothetical protein
MWQGNEPPHQHADNRHQERFVPAQVPNNCASQAARQQDVAGDGRLTVQPILASYGAGLPFASFSANQETISDIIGSKPPGKYTLNSAAGWELRFSKS